MIRINTETMDGQLYLWRQTLKKNKVYKTDINVMKLNSISCLYKLINQFKTTGFQRLLQIEKYTVVYKFV